MPFYKRSIFLIDPSFQLKFSLAISSLIIISSLIYPVVIVDFFDQFINSNPQIKPNVIEARNDLILFLIIIQLVYSVFVFTLFVFMTHKVAGPMFKLKTHLSDIRQGQAITPLVFRAGDHFKDVADEVSLFLETISMNQEADFQYLDEVALYVENLATVVPDDKKPVMNEISRRLMDIQLRYKKDL